MVRAVPLRRKRKPAPPPGVAVPGDRTLALIRADARVQELDDERAMGNSVIITLRQGWTFTPGEDNRVDGADTPTDALRLLRSAKPFAGPYTT